MADPRPGPGPGDEPEIADVNWLLGDPPAKSPPKKSTPPPAADPGEGYSIGGVDHDEPPDLAPAPPIPPPPPRAERPRPKPKPKAGDEDREEAGRPSRKPKVEEATVDEVWTRWGEWGPNLLVLGLALLASGGAVVFALMQGWLAVAFVLALLAGAGLLLLAYPIAITLERPVRMTPEQAVRDYYAALSHLLPHYRRAWLLLSSAGKTSRVFDSFAGFRSYWEGRREALKAGRAGKYTPLKFEVVDFKSEKSAGLSAIPAKYTLKVSLGGQPSEGPLATYRIETGLVKGPDRMWYLNDGTLPDTPAR